jgi:hypothetical protein
MAFSIAEITSPKVHGFNATMLPLKFEGYNNANWAACKDSRRSTSSHLFSISNGAVEMFK